MATAVEEQVPPKVRLCLQVLACRYSSYTTQYILQCKTVKKLLTSLGERTENLVQCHRRILRGNRLASYLKQEKNFERIGVLGAGGFGTVELVKSKDNNKFYALKSVKAKLQRSVHNFNILAMIERDCAIAVESPCFVKLKAAWIETNPETGDCFKFLWENFIYGDLDGLIAQLHPMTTRERSFTTGCVDTRYFRFHLSTFRLMLQGVDFENMFYTNHVALRLLFAETGIIKDAGRQRDYIHTIYLYLKQLLEGIRFLHSRNITHRDLKPGNILVSNDMSLRIADLGLATLFEVTHVRPLHSWTLFEGMERRQEDVPIALGSAKERAKYFSDYFGQKTQLDPVGTRMWTGPEFNDAFYETPKYEPLKFNPMSYRLGDYYALGVITFQILTGLHPIHHTLKTYGPLLFNENIRIQSSRDHLVKVMPRQFNPLLHRRRTIEQDNFNKLFIDMRLHAVIVGLMEPDPRNRLDFEKTMQDRNYASLSNELYVFHPNPFIWNGWVRQPVETPYSKCARRYRRGPPAPPVLQEGRSVPPLPGFPLITESPGMIGSPYELTPPPPRRRTSSSSESPEPKEKTPPKKLPKGMRRCLVAKRSPPRGAVAW